MSGPIVLGIESTCDETAASVVQGRTLISNVVASSMDEHCLLYTSDAADE